MIREHVTKRTSIEAGWLVDAITVALGAYMIAVGARIRVSLPFTPVPITAQTFVVLLIGALLGRKRGVLSTSLYLVAGGFGLPLFAHGSAGALAGPTGGYVVGFVAAAWIAGLWIERGWDTAPVGPALGLLIANAAVYLVGLPWLARFVGLRQALALGLFPFVVGDLIKVAAATGLLSVVRRYPREDRGIE